MSSLRNPSHPYQFGWFDWFCLWYPPGWLILFNRHWQHYHVDPDGWIWPEYLLFLLPGGFYLALLLRWIRLGCRAPSRSPQQIDPRYQQAFRQELLHPILKHYFRAELKQAENLPLQGPAIAIMNHAGMCFPWDFVGLAYLLAEQNSWSVQPFAHALFFDHIWMRWWLPIGWSSALGGIPADRDRLEAALSNPQTNQLLLYAPEALRGLTKGWANRYQLATFDPSFVQMSDRYRIPILPVVCLGNESLHPWAIHLKRIGQRLNLPIFPLSPLLIPFVLFPSLGVWAMRTRLKYIIQPIEAIWETHPQPLQRYRTAYRLAQELRSHMQSAVDGLVNLSKRRKAIAQPGDSVTVS